MRSTLPPLNALRAFEAAARHQSFAKAADELSVTPAAISHQIKALEDRLGVVLFRRLTRQLKLTKAGHAALPALSAGFDQLAEATEILQSAAAQTELIVSASPSFGAMWLVPKLDEFRRSFPNVDIRLDGTDQLVDLRAGDADIAIRYGGGNYPGVRTDLLFHQFNTPVCSPDLLEGPNAIRAPSDLANHQLLHTIWRDAEASWRMWLLAVGVEGVDATRGPQFSAESMAVEAALNGQGVALMGDRIIADHLASGRLVRPFSDSLRTDLSLAFYVLTPRDLKEGSYAAGFRDWLLTYASDGLTTGEPAA